MTEIGPASGQPDEDFVLHGRRTPIRFVLMYWELYRMYFSFKIDRHTGGKFRESDKIVNYIAVVMDAFSQLFTDQLV